MKAVTVLGAGSFGTVLANIAASNVEHVNLWMRSANQAQEVQTTRKNKRYFPSASIADNITATSDISQAITDSELIIVAAPSKAFISVMEQTVPFIHPQAIILSATKGIDTQSFQTMHQLLVTTLKTHNLNNQIGILSGPNLATEIAQKHFTASVLASTNHRVFYAATSVLNTEYFRLYHNTDIIGIELCGALKNIYAIAAGLMDAMKMGNNSKSMLLTRSLAEMSRFCKPLGANPMTFLGLAGIGDLMATCTSNLSRNYSVGFALGEGKTLEQILKSLNQVAEGVNTLSAVYAKAQLENISMPLANGLYKIIFENQPIDVFEKALMQTEHEDDVEYPFTVV